MVLVRDAYKATGRVGKAAACYVLSAEMVPCRLLPRYKLFCLYREVDNTVWARETARQALGVEVKVGNTKVLRMKGIFKDFLLWTKKINTPVTSVCDGGNQEINLLQVED